MTDVSEQSVAEVLNRAADLLEPEGAWIGGPSLNFASDGDGAEVDPKDESACCWCLYGAIEAAAPSPGVDSAACNALGKAVGTQMLAMWNHNGKRTQQEVVAALRQAALLAAPRAGEGVDRG